MPASDFSMAAPCRSERAAGILVIILVSVARMDAGPAARGCFSRSRFAIFLMSAAWLGGSGVIGAQTAWLFVFGLPVLLAGTWLGMKLYGRIDEAAFRKAVLVVLLVSGVALMLV